MTAVRTFATRIATSRPPSLGEIVMWRQVFGIASHKARPRVCVTPALAATLAGLACCTSVAAHAGQSAAAGLAVAAIVSALLDDRVTMAAQRLERAFAARPSKPRRGRALQLLGRFDLALFASSMPLAYAADWTNSEALAVVLVNAVVAAVVLYLSLWHAHVLRAALGLGGEPARRISLSEAVARCVPYGPLIALASALIALAASVP